MLSVFVGSELPLTPATLAAPSSLPSFSAAELIQFLTSSSFRTSKADPTNLPGKFSPTVSDTHRTQTLFAGGFQPLGVQITSVDDGAFSDEYQGQRKTDSTCSSSDCYDFILERHLHLIHCLFVCLSLNVSFLTAG
jgi:hypothetical protein